jgi:hypothetical protein
MFCGKFLKTFFSGDLKNSNNTKNSKKKEESKQMSLPVWCSLKNLNSFEHKKT